MSRGKICLTNEGSCRLGYEIVQAAALVMANEFDVVICLLFFSGHFCGFLPLVQSFLDLNHPLTIQRIELHGNDIAEPSDDGQAEIQKHGDPEDGPGRLIAKLGNGSGVANQRNTYHSQGGGEGGYNLIYERIHTRKNSGEVVSGPFVLIIHQVRLHSAAGGGQNHVGSGFENIQDYIDHKRQAESAELLHTVYAAACHAEDDEHGDGNRGGENNEV